MAGNIEQNKSGRKQWKIAGLRTPVGRLSGLNYSVEDGCPDSHVVLAKRLLDEKCADVDQEQNAILGVYWLIKASERGHIEATDILRKCLETGRGINKYNINDVRTCLSMSLEEKVSRHAARELFASLSQGEDFITSNQLLDEIARTQQSCSRREEVNNSVQGAAGGDSASSSDDDLSSCSNSEKLTEDVLVSAASYYSRGELPVVHRALMLSTCRDNGRRGVHSTRNSRLLAPVFGYYSCIVKSLGDRPISSFMPLDTKCIQTLFLLFIYSLFGFDGLIDALPTFFYYASLLLMVVTTCKVLVKKWEFNHFKEWSNLLVAWGGPGVNPENAQWTNCYNNMHPCFLFLFSLIFNILLTPFVPIFSIPYSEIVIFSTIFAFVTLYNFAWTNGKLDFLVLLSFGISLLASYPWEMDAVVSKGWRFLDVHIPTFLSHIVGNGIEFCLNFKLIFYLLKPVLLVKMAARDRWRGFYYTLIPHLISLSWWQMAVNASNGATSFGLIRACLALVGLLLLVPLMGVAMILLPVAALLRLFLNTESVIPVSTSFIGAAVSLIVLIYLNIRSKFTGRKSTVIQIVLVLISSAILISSHLSMNRSDSRFGEGTTSLSYSQVKSFCSAGAAGDDQDLSVVSVVDDDRCATLAGIYVHWEGRVQSARISKIHNPISSIIHMLPIEIQRVALCMFGIQFDDCEGKEDCRLPVHLSNKCHIKNWNRYEYEIIVQLSSSNWGNSEDTKIILKSDNQFTNFTRHLFNDDKIWFSGRLIIDPIRSRTISSNVKQKFYVHLDQAGCLVCRNADLQPVLTGTAAYGISELNISAKNLLNFLFNPVVRFK